MLSMSCFVKHRFSALYIITFCILSLRKSSGNGLLQLEVQQDYVVLDNGLLQLTFTKPGGHLICIRYNGLDNLLELHNPLLNGGFWDLNWSKPGTSGTRGEFDVANGTDFQVVVQNEEQVELSFTRKWDASMLGQYAPLSIDKRFIMLCGSSGFYSYAIYQRDETMPAFYLNEARIALMLNIEKFVYMAMSDDRQRRLPRPEDRVPPRGRELAFPEAVLLVDPIEPEFKGEVDDKYQYSCENKDNKVHGFICTDPTIGLWQISPSNEFRTGGPIKQDLTSHVNPTTLAMFVSTHYGGEDLVVKFGDGEEWKKVFGPVFIYLNSVSDYTNDSNAFLWSDAKDQMKKEVEKWPYSFPVSEDFLHVDQRGSVCGRLFAQDRYISEGKIAAKGAFVGLAPPGKDGSFQKEAKGYQFWVNADDDGYFKITNIRPGVYNIYAWVPGFIGDYRCDKDIVVAPGSSIDLGDLVYFPPRNGATLWEIGIPDRSAAEFYVPDPDPMYINKLLVNLPSHRFRQYGLWQRYADLYPNQDLVYTIGTSDYKKDWFYAQVTRKIGESAYKATTWQIKFELDEIAESGKYTLRIALASATFSILEVRVNKNGLGEALFSSGLIGSDNTITRHGIHGLYWQFNVEMETSLFNEGDNTIYLTQARNFSALHGVMYDYVRLEAPSFTSNKLA
ncbi:probable rhamnogalacturonate lyase B isoform X1 [Salvia splendens]|uniref:probable rhamnogalacturonate lyase B isoform X1 n=2 Tax=Salvia splendens TaxID=180675 RepID=UPI001C278779|nr:probable rhamnogalacturonate lyase B isoform X1 [Salvia splendens]